ncbi:phage tail protein [Vibrio cholerae]|uniref:phage tail protein n=1 Tax=Vibrio cholerae TaxID=666 RepID=UPI000B978EC8|nr:phage tail protein [Vibrio cholerae]EGQ9962132.1 phage tail protein [Vibrio cholerae]EGQ9983353.1 phage tail protein [Vibrio cholerae]EGR1084642.1 phage tail protein [Vibrio cholerae]EGR4228746.1 phage tail protein [Vibrio cholerae]EGR4328881.1 phage tail protein [Vibrio cholerae]
MDKPETLLQKFFAFEDALMLEHVEGAVEITEQQYNEALAAKIAGRKAFVREGELVIFSGVMRTIWNCKDGSTKEIDEQELIPEGWTDKERKTAFDRWMDGEWVTDISAKYIDEFNQVDNLRRSLYFAMVDPLVSEANIKRLQGKEAEAIELERQAIAAREKIQLENPWPVNPEA